MINNTWLKDTSPVQMTGGEYNCPPCQKWMREEMSRYCCLDQGELTNKILKQSYFTFMCSGWYLKYQLVNIFSKCDILYKKTL